MDIKDYKKASLDFRRIASNMLTTEYNNPNIPLYRFKNYIDTNEIIKSIVQDAIHNVNYNYKDCFTIDNNDYDDPEINPPIDEKQHLKAMYDYISYIVDNKMNVMNLSFKYPCSSNKITDVIQNFLSLAFKPMVEYIIDELSKLIIMEEEEMKGFTINNEKGVVNVADRNSSIKSNNTMLISDNDIEKITQLISKLKEEISKSAVSNEEKENVVDDLDIIQEQLNDSVTKPARFKKAVSNIKNFLVTSSGVIGAGVTLGNNINKLVEMVNPIIEKIG